MRAKLSVFTPTFCFSFLNAFQEIGTHFFVPNFAVANKLQRRVKAIRKMEPAWEKVQGRKFAFSSRTYQLPNGGTKEVPCYVLTKTECLYIATKFNDEARAKLVLRWEELERAYRGQINLGTDFAN